MSNQICLSPNKLNLKIYIRWHKKNKVGLYFTLCYGVNKLLPLSQASHKLPFDIAKTKTHRSHNGTNDKRSINITLHFIHPTPGFSHRTGLGSSTETTLWCCSWWTVNHSFQTTYVILPTWLGDALCEELEFSKYHSNSPSYGTYHYE
jgi:hypothetical protein